MAGDFDARLQALDDKIETNRLATQEQFRVVNDTLVRHGVSLARIEERLDGLDDGQGRIEVAMADLARTQSEILRRLPEPGDS